MSVSLQKTFNQVSNYYYSIKYRDLAKHIPPVMIKLGREHNFAKMRSNTRGLQYDYGSVMHYGAYAFSRNDQPTIITLNGARIGQRNGLSSTDWQHVLLNYC